MKRVPIRKPLPGHSGAVSELAFREPRFEDLIAVGAEPETPVWTRDGIGFMQENVPLVAQYAERLVTNVDGAQLSQLGLADALAVKRAILDFFREAANAPPPSPTTSSSPSDGTPPASAG